MSRFNIDGTKEILEKVFPYISEESKETVIWKEGTPDYIKKMHDDLLEKYGEEFERLEEECLQ